MLTSKKKLDIRFRAFHDGAGKLCYYAKNVASLACTNTPSPYAEVAWHDIRRVAINQFDVLGLTASAICTWTEPRSLRCVIFWVWICTFGSHSWHPSCVYHSVASGEQVFVGYYLNISNLYAFDCLPIFLIINCSLHIYIIFVPAV